MKEPIGGDRDAGNSQLPHGPGCQYVLTGEKANALCAETKRFMPRSRLCTLTTFFGEQRQCGFTSGLKARWEAPRTMISTPGLLTSQLTVSIPSLRSSDIQVPRCLRSRRRLGEGNNTKHLASLEQEFRP